MYYLQLDLGLSFLVYLKCSAKTIGIIGFLIIFLHNLSPNLSLAEASLFKRLLMPFFAPNAFSLGRGITFVVGYPPIPWLGIMLAGFWVGTIFEKTVESRKKLFLKIGISSLLLFVLLRFINIYGDSFQWAIQKNYLFTFMSFINVTKYPPSLLFCLLTLGIMFLILSLIEGMKNKFTDIATVYGKVPLFYFVIHWFNIHPILFAIVFLQGFKSSDLLFGFNFGRPKGTSGVEL
ncbi:MAG: hypothetical protein SGI96_21915 [Bacteroidota bacterium]|nr:hypothetical protein [Bacteroidota bacterium]